MISILFDFSHFVNIAAQKTGKIVERKSGDAKNSRKNRQST